MSVNMVNVAQTVAPAIAAGALAVAEAPLLLAAIVGGGLVLVGVWAGQGFPGFRAEA